MNNELMELLDRLEQDATLQVELGGAGKAEFLFVRSSKRAVEVSLAEKGIFIEYWNDADEQSDEAPSKSELVHSKAEALANIFYWLH